MLDDFAILLMSLAIPIKMCAYEKGLFTQERNLYQLYSHLF